MLVEIYMITGKCAPEGHFYFTNIGENPTNDLTHENQYFVYLSTETTFCVNPICQ